MDRKTKFLLNVLLVVGLFFLLYLAKHYLNSYMVRIITLGGVYIVLAVSYNLVNGITGQFSLGPNAFMAVGAYTASLLTLSAAAKQQMFFIEPLIWPFNSIQIHFFPATLLGGVAGGITAYLVGIPSFRLRGDYLAIVTLGFGEIVRVIANNVIPLTNGALGLKDIPNYTNIYWAWGWAVFTFFFIRRLTDSSYGRAFKAIREDEIAAEAMGISPFKHKMLSFVISGFFAGVGGALLAHLITTISPVLFSFFITFNLLIIIVLGGLGSSTGAAIAAVLFAVISELLRAIESPMNLGFIHIPGIPGMRMVVFAVLLVVFMIFWPRGIMGRKELTWDLFFSRKRGGVS